MESPEVPGKNVEVNEYQEALEIVDESACESLSRKYLKKHYTLLKELVDIYPEYLELKLKATPKKPTKTHVSNGHVYHHCPECGYEVGDIENFNFCKQCGQSIERSKDER